LKKYSLVATLFAAGLIATFAIPSDKSSASIALTLRVESETATGLVVSWTPPAGAEGYEFKRDGVRVSNTWSGSLNEVSFGKPAGTHTYEVDALLIGSSGSLTRPLPPPTTTTTPTTTTAQIVVKPGDSWNDAYQAAAPGSVISVQAGSYGDQVIAYRADLANSGKPPVTIRVDGPATVSKLEIHGNDLVIEGNNQLNATGYIDTEADSATQHPDHVTVQDAHSTSFGVFNVDTATFKNLDVGPATVSTGCATLQGNGFENKIGSASGIVYNPTNVTLDGLTIHDQNGDSGRIDSDCHDGGLFLAGVSGLTVKNTVFQANVVYNVQIQPINGAPITNVTFDHDSFGCPVNWLYQNNNPLACDGQSSVQFDGTFPGVSITNSAFSEGVGANGWGCYAGTCDYSQDTFSNNELLAQSTTAAPLP